MSVTLVKCGVSKYRISNDRDVYYGFGEHGLVKMGVVLSKEQFGDLEAKLNEVFVSEDGRYFEKKNRELISDTDMIVEFSRLVSEISDGNTKRFKFDLATIKTPKQLFEHAGVRILEIDSDDSMEFSGTIVIRENNRFRNIDELWEILVGRVSAPISVSVKDLKKYVRDYLYSPKPKSKSADQKIAPAKKKTDELLDFLLINKITAIEYCKNKPEPGYEIIYENGSNEFRYENLQKVYEYLVERSGIEPGPDLCRDFMSRFS